MEYISTRGSAPSLDFAGATLAGLASDGGLYVPREWPRFSADEIAAMVGLPYAALAAKIMAPFVAGSLSEERLLALCEAAYGRFAHAAVTPLKQLDEQQWLLELFHGPTLAFKDDRRGDFGRYRLGGDRRGRGPRQGRYFHAPPQRARV
jgi:threonine synthase